VSERKLLAMDKFSRFQLPERLKQGEGKMWVGKSSPEYLEEEKFFCQRDDAEMKSEKRGKSVWGFARSILNFNPWLFFIIHRSKSFIDVNE